jgi:hypothetical protein
MGGSTDDCSIGVQLLGLLLPYIRPVLLQTALILTEYNRRTQMHPTIWDGSIGLIIIVGVSIIMFSIGKFLLPAFS